MKELSALDLNFDVEITGFETAEIDLLIDGATAPIKADRSDIVPEPQTEAVSRLGDLWLLGRVDVEDILDVIFREFCMGK